MNTTANAFRRLELGSTNFVSRVSKTTPSEDSYLVRANAIRESPCCVPRAPWPPAAITMNCLP
jgi:hypothetical protein